MEAIRWDDNTMKDIAKADFNSTCLRPTFKYWNRGLTVLLSLPQTNAQIKGAIVHSEYTAAVPDTYAWKVGEPPRPPTNWHGLLKMLWTHCSVLLALFGDQCSFYAGLFNIANLAEHMHCKEEGFTPAICAKITYWILVNGLDFFNEALAPSDWETSLPMCDLR